MVKKTKTVKTSKKTPVTREQRAARTIKILAKENPRRKGTDAHKYHEAMAKSPTVGDYLKRFKDPKARRDASIWLSAAQRDGHVKVAA